MRLKLKTRAVDVRIGMLYFTLLASFFNDTVRIPGTAVSLYRMLIVPAILICLSLCLKRTLKYCFFWLFASVLSLLFSKLFFSGVRGFAFQPKSDLKFSLLLFGVVVIVCIVDVLQRKDGAFEERIFLMVRCAAVIYVLIMLHFHMNRERIIEMLHNGSAQMQNINNYGTCLAAVFPLFWLRGKANYLDYFICALMAAACYLNDCKLALLGILLEILLLYVLRFYLSDRGSYRSVATVILLFAVGTAAVLANTNLRINEYYVKEIVAEPIKRILTLRPYERSNVSTTFRTNMIIYGLRELLHNKLVGIGFGNASRLIRSLLPDRDLGAKWLNKDAISVHNCWLELMLETGLLGIVGLAALYRRILAALKKNRGWIDRAMFVTVTAFWIWGMQPSGMWTIFYVHAVLASLYFLSVKAPEQNRCADRRTSLHLAAARAAFPDCVGGTYAES